MNVSKKQKKRERETRGEGTEKRGKSPMNGYISLCSNTENSKIRLESKVKNINVSCSLT